MYSSLALSIFTLLYNHHHHLFPELFSFLWTEIPFPLRLHSCLPQPLATIVLPSVSMNLTTLVPHTSGITQYLTLCVWFISLNIISSRLSMSYVREPVFDTCPFWHIPGILWTHPYFPAQQNMNQSFLQGALNSFSGEWHLVIKYAHCYWGVISSKSSQWVELRNVFCACVYRATYLGRYRNRCMYIYTCFCISLYVLETHQCTVNSPIPI